jgi:hypothetical protein
MVQKQFDQIRAVFLKKRLSAGDLNQRCGRIGFNLPEYFGYRHVQAFIIGVPGIAVSAPEIAPAQADENAGESGIQGLTLNAVKNFIDSE